MLGHYVLEVLSLLKRHRFRYTSQIFPLEPHTMRFLGLISSGVLLAVLAAAQSTVGPDTPGASTYLFGFYLLIYLLTRIPFVLFRSCSLCRSSYRNRMLLLSLLCRRRRLYHRRYNRMYANYLYLKRMIDADRFSTSWTDCVESSDGVLYCDNGITPGKYPC